MYYNVNDPLKFLNNKKFYKYCVAHLIKGNLKILPDIVSDIWLLVYLRFVKFNSITIKYLYYGCLLNPNEFNRLLKIDIEYGIREYFELVNELFLKYNPSNDEELFSLFDDPKLDIINEVRELDNKYNALVEKISIEEAAFKYYGKYVYDHTFNVNYDSYASYPGNLSISKVKMKYLINSYKSVCNKGFFKKQMKEAVDLLKNGDVQPGKVVSVSPLKIFAYSDEFDGGVMLKYPDEFVNYYNLSVNQKVIFVNNYWFKEVFSYRYDLLIGENPTKEWRDVIPLMAVLFSDETDLIDSHISNIEEELWEAVDEAIVKYIEKYNDYAREGMEFFIQEK